MKRNGMVAFLASIVLIVVLLASGCGNGGGGSAQEDTYRVLNPVGVFIPVETQALSPRIDSFNGKTIYVIQGEADPVIMPALAGELPRQYPNSTFVYYEPQSSFGASAPDDTTIAEADGVIRGIGW